PPRRRPPPTPPSLARPKFGHLTTVTVVNCPNFRWGTRSGQVAQLRPELGPGADRSFAEPDRPALLFVLDVEPVVDRPRPVTPREQRGEAALVPVAHDHARSIVVGRHAPVGVGVVARVRTRQLEV